MASYSLDDFVGNGVLRDALPSLIADGWDDVPTLKMMNARDMEDLKLTQNQREALELRTYLHDRSLMEYADNLETLGKPLSKLLEISPSLLTSQYGMKRGHVARFVDRASACGIAAPPMLSSHQRKRTLASRYSIDAGREFSSGHVPRTPKRYENPSPPDSLAGMTPHRAVSPDQSSSESSRSSAFSHSTGEAFKTYSTTGTGENEGKANKLSTQKGIVAAAPAMPRLCGILKPFEIVDNVTPLSVLEKIPIQKLTPEYRKGVDPWALGGMKVPPPSRAGELWAKRPTLILCVRRPGCVMCRAEAHQLYARKAMFDAMDIQLVAVFNEYIDSEVRSFWPRYWGGAVAVDKNREFFCALGGGKLLKDNIVTGFFFNPRAIANYKRARATGIENNRHGEGTVKGGLYIMRPGNGGVAYQFIERNFGDWAPLEEVLDVCSNLQKNSPATPVTHEDFSFDP
ncbi:hypothetical protein O6H91_09G103700 [Diphasiastrum complanatum]|uniref:Uncharacterized protein n=12 Tax=Diphasiastrum complanatum TaxID=34168 RepID=A0ACC2CSS1_DIPCM|nr:hypothetical protein O6H91_09G103700 [Diphasiastrum complanatum]KAJ7545028.1 hypothetical protein O6H91_09G103700 [Diphasiastrum complanatum]KAJ7545029.1 hypothetical protein O6H91_09G103700 [Diphasiastrum complanatum]KAJ7545030.1 hypothetical protein O6H91_09G103700 [Diphasiastrum complanatum]KAJ7545031.1 hypothetical protein O6H91_09G103700 [Diphasiastrum complanatum]